MKDPKGFENGHCGNLSCDVPRWLYKLCGRIISHNNGNFERKFGPRDLMYYGEFCSWYVWVVVFFFLQFSKLQCACAMVHFTFVGNKWDVNREFQSTFCIGMCWDLCFVQALELLYVWGYVFIFTSLKNNLIGVGASFVTNEIGTKITNEFIENEIEAFRSFMTLSSNLIGYAANSLNIIILTHSLH